MTKALLLIGSPRGKKSTSANVGNYILEKLKEKGLETDSLIIRSQLTSKEKINQMLKALESADIIILGAPLYDDCQPYIVTKTFEIILEKKINLIDKKFISLISCGFPEPHQISEAAVPIYKIFAKKVGLDWVGSLAIGGGEMFNVLQRDSGKSLEELGKIAERLLEALDQISEALATGKSYQDLELFILPKFWYSKPMLKIVSWMNNRGWKKMAKEKGVKVEVQPYLKK